MALLGRLHPLLIHFPIALVLAAVAAESVASLASSGRWRLVAIANVRAGAILALLAAAAGWRMAAQLVVEESTLLQWHRWCGTGAAGLAFAAACATFAPTERSAIARACYRVALFGAGALVGVAGHLGGVLVWGADFLRP